MGWVKRKPLTATLAIGNGLPPFQKMKTGFNNVAVGRNTAGWINSATSTTLIGAGAGRGYHWATAQIGYSIYVGAEAGYLSNDVVYNSVLGYRALYNNITGSYNTISGAEASYRNISATNTVAIGYRAAYGLANYSNQGGVYLGYRAGFSASTGSDYNTLLGYQAGYDITTGQTEHRPRPVDHHRRRHHHGLQ
ncbi:MAG: hypothetical protein KatS3mg099_130 [Candidatus Parcubacteria bacterium]|nr:MAG: hypothetical protein KatS3mg099_130 [Candidatus Parcubacteria bacterium]